MACLWN